MIAFWIALALLTGATLLLLVLPLLRRNGAPVDQATYDIAVYKDQLAEVDRDRERGLLSEEQAAAARLEIERRILAAAPVRQAPVTGRQKAAAAQATADAAPGRGVSGPARVAGIAALVAVPVGAVALYMALGTPGMPDQPHAMRVAAQMDMDAQQAQDMVRLTEQLADRLEQEPENAEGWAMLGRSYSALGRYDAAVRAFRQAVQRGQTDGDTWAALGEAQVAAEGGQVSQQAAIAFRNALGKNRQDPRSRYYLGLFQLQAGEGRTALAIWRDLETTSPEGAPWLPMIQDAIRQVAVEQGIPPISVAPTHPLLLPAGGAQPTPPPAAAAGPRADAPPSAEAPAGQGEAAAPDAGPDADPGAAMRAEADAQRAARGSGFTAEEQEMIAGMVQGLADRLKENPGDYEGWMRLGQAYMVLERPVDAVDAYQGAVGQRPGSLDALRSLANAQAMAARALGLERPEDGFYATLRAILEANPGDVAALKLLGDEAATAGDTDAARGYWTRLRDVLPADSPDRAEVERRLEALGS